MKTVKKYVLRLCECDYGGGKIHSESVHDTFEEAMDAIPSQFKKGIAASMADLKNTVDDAGAWSICDGGSYDLAYIIHTRWY